MNTDIDLLNRVIEAKIVTPYALAKRSGLQLSTVLRGLHGEVEIKVSTVIRLSSALSDILAEDKFKRSQFDALMAQA